MEEGTNNLNIVSLLK